MRETTPVEKALSNDPIREFETLSGKSYKMNNDTENKAMLGLAMIRNKQKADLLKEENDTTFTMTGDEYQANKEEFAFEVIYEEAFVATHCGSTYNDELKVFWREGILLYFDTYGGTRNGGKFWYNWDKSDNAEYGCTSSGGMHDGIWVGDHDCREAVRFNIRRLETNGTLLKQWKKCPSCLWITHYGERDEIFGHHDWASKEPHPADAATQSRIDQFPQAVQKAILR